MKQVKPSIRFLDEMKNVLYDQEWAKTAPNFEVYYMWRGVKEKKGLRYDITLIPPKMLGKEFVKTKGNRNSNNFLELYTILQGEAIFLLQKMKGKKIEDVFTVKAKKGEFVIDPLGYYIVSINPSKENLRTGNWIPKNNKNIYRDIERMEGACYYYTEKGWVKNKNYKIVPKLRCEKPLKERPINLDFLRKPRW